MTAPFLVPCLVQLRTQFNHEFPDRAKGADGWIGDTAHQSGTSDHNPRSNGAVLALDVTTAVNRPGIDLDDAFQLIIKRHQAGDDYRLEYAIWQRKIYSRSRGYKPVAYTLSDPHTGHAHFSARHDNAGHDNTAPWGLEELMTKAELKEALDDYFGVGKQADGSQTSKIGRDSLSQGIPQGDGQPNDPRWPAWKVISDTRRMVAELKKQAGVLEQKIDALKSKA